MSNYRSRLSEQKRPGRYRSSADNPDRQACYFNKPGDDVFYNTFISERIKEGEYSEGIYFKIEKVRGNSDKENFDAKRILEDDTGNVRSDGIYAASKAEQDEAGAQKETKDLETLLKTFTEENKNQQSQNSSQDNNVVPKKLKRRSDYSNTKRKARNLPTNVAYRHFKRSDFMKDSFAMDLLSFLVQNCNPLNLEIKLETEKEREMIKFVWDICIPHEFVSFMLKHNSYNVISQPNLTIVKSYILEDGNRINQLKYKIAEKSNLIHYIYSFLYAKIYNRTNSFGAERKNDFDFQFQM